jgi:hypothetical protein
MQDPCIGQVHLSSIECIGAMMCGPSTQSWPYSRSCATMHLWMHTFHKLHIRCALREPHTRTMITSFFVQTMRPRIMLNEVATGCRTHTCPLRGAAQWFPSDCTSAQPSTAQLETSSPSTQRSDNSQVFRSLSLHRTFEEP